MPRRFHIQPLQRIRFVAGARFVKIFRSVRELRREFRHKLHANFVTTRANRRTDRGQQIGGAAAILKLHPSHGFLRDARKRAAPTRMNRRDCAFFWIDQ